MLPTSTATGAAAALARSEGANELTKGIATAAPPTAPAAQVRPIAVRRELSAGLDESVMTSLPDEPEWVGSCVRNRTQIEETLDFSLLRRRRAEPAGRAAASTQRHGARDERNPRDAPQTRHRRCYRSAIAQSEKRKDKK